MAGLRKNSEFCSTTDIFSIALRSISGGKDTDEANTSLSSVHWIVPIIGTSFFGIGMLGSFMPIATYLIDAWPLYAASSTAASTVLRSLFGAILPLAGQQMYAKLGLGWGNSVLGFIALAMVPVPFVFMKFGERIRTSKRFQLDL